MRSYEVVPPFVHGFFDYVGGIFLFLAPNVFGFWEYGGEATWLPRILGVAIIGLALVTDYQMGVFKIVPMMIHKIIDYIAGAALVLSPFIFGFFDGGDGPWLPHVVVGAFILLLTLVTESVSETEISGSAVSD